MLGSFWDDFFCLWLSLTWSSLSFYILRFISGLYLPFTFLHLCFSMFSFLPHIIHFFPPSASSSLSSSQDMSLLTSSDRKYKHTYQLRCFLSISLSHLENLSLPPKHDNTEKAMKGRYGLHWEHRRNDWSEMEKISTEEWERDGLLIVSFGVVGCNICEILCVTKCLFHARFMCSVHWLLVYVTAFLKVQVSLELFALARKIHLSAVSGWRWTFPIPRVPHKLIFKLNHFKDRPNETVGFFPALSWSQRVTEYICVSCFCIFKVTKITTTYFLSVSLPVATVILRTTKSLLSREEPFKT